jgi:hypothetical protein
MKGRIFAILFCVAVTFLLVNIGTTGQASSSNIESTVAVGQGDAQHLANGPKQIPPGWEKTVFVHYRKPPAKPGGAGKPPKSDSQCYSFLGRGVKWSDPSNSAFLVDATNRRDLVPADVLAAVNAAAGAWRDETSADILPPAAALTEGLEADWDSPDGQNEIVFGDSGYKDAIAVTIVWRFVGGPPSQRGIVEFDMILDDAQFNWSAEAGEVAVAGKMDLQNIATHEFGHAVGLADLYQSSCTEVTMYGYSTQGELKKRSLEPDDITGLQTLYGQ